ncbi:MAG TPA: type II toxin-antitoxin system HicB family antitoxin [Solirubrobacterales bacterium]
MPVLTASNTVYTHPVAKVMISIPDKLLERLDARARAMGETRSGFLQRLAEREVEIAENREQTEIRDLLRQIASLEPGAEPTKSAAQMVREDRESH